MFEHPKDPNESPRQISRSRHLGNIAVGGFSGILVLEEVYKVAENTPLAIILGAVVATSAYRLMEKLS